MALSPSTIEVVKATAPVLAVHGEQIIKVFYGHLFTDYPVMKNVFNMTHQKTGDQPRSLAHAVHAYASHIDNLPALKGAVEQIVHKHVSVNVKPEHYPIVGSLLLRSIKEVLGESATPEIMRAWEEAYNFLADLLIEAEEKLYQEHEQKKGGWRDGKTFVVFKKVKESEEIYSFYLKPEDGGEVPAFEEGQYLGVQVKVDGAEYLRTRNYSLSNASGEGYYRISVKDEGDNATSAYMHQFLKEGDTLTVFPPAGVFTLANKNAPAVFISGGIGQTPLLSMLQALLKDGTPQPIHYIHACRNGQVHAFGEQLRQWENAHDNLKYACLYEEPTVQDISKGGFEGEGRLDADFLKKYLIEGADYYFCGPKGFMRSVKELLNALGVPDEKQHFEFFGPMADIAPERVNA